MGGERRRPAAAAPRRLAPRRPRDARDPGRAEGRLPRRAMLPRSGARRRRRRAAAARRAGRAEEAIDAEGCEARRPADDDRRTMRAPSGSVARSARARGTKGMTLPSWTIESPLAARATSKGATRVVPRTASSGIAAATRSPRRPERRGTTATQGQQCRRWSRGRARFGCALRPRGASAASRTTSSPTPRPETSVTVADVVRPPSRSSRTISSSARASARDTEVPFARAARRTASTSTPCPSSLSTKATRLPRRTTSS